MRAWNHKASLLPDGFAIAAARERLAGVARPTPLARSPWLSERVGVAVHLKLECWQRTHSFKLRGAYNAVAALDPATRRRGLVTASAGNHGLAVAHAARLHGAPATVIVPRGAPATKKARIRREGAELREVEGTYDDAAAAARALADERDAHLLHAFADPEVVAGQATVGLEIVESLPDVREVVVPVGGGGLAAGVGAALRDRAPAARVLGVQSTATRAMRDAFEA
ncbi:MAG: threonine ammonia-lyase, partial [Gemmatimonadota bacterium]